VTACRTSRKGSRETATAGRSKNCLGLEMHKKRAIRSQKREKNEKKNTYAFWLCSEDWGWEQPKARGENITISGKMILDDPELKGKKQAKRGGGLLRARKSRDENPFSDVRLEGGQGELTARHYKCNEMSRLTWNAGGLMTWANNGIF